jgi:hypothetical protein
MRSVRDLFKANYSFLEGDAKLDVREKSMTKIKFADERSSHKLPLQSLFVALQRVVEVKSELVRKVW